jgi:hypothetical protein
MYRAHNWDLEDGNRTWREPKAPREIQSMLKIAFRLRSFLSFPGVVDQVMKPFTADHAQAVN